MTTVSNCTLITDKITLSKPPKNVLYIVIAFHSRGMVI